MTFRYLATSIATLALALPSSASANSSTMVEVLQKAGSSEVSSGWEQFTPRADQTGPQIDYSHWDEALQFLVIPMGPSTREGAPSVEANLGTRRIYGHQSRYRLEGNRVAFSFLNEDVLLALTEYKRDLEQVGSSIEIARLSRNEQLAFWLNLHNVAVIEAIAHDYPMTQPSRRQFASDTWGLDDAKLVEVSGVSLSPREIREKIVFPNWDDPKVIYGFFRGEIGGPSIQRLAFNASNVDQLLSLSAEEFVNSLRGVERTGKTLRVSRIYDEAAAYYFPDSSSLRSHLNEFARDDVKEVISRTTDTRINYYEGDLADLARGNSDPGLSQFATLTDPTGGERKFRAYEARSLINPGGKIDPAIQRFMIERTAKLKKVFKRGLRTGTVIYGGDPDQARNEAAEVE